MARLNNLEWVFEKKKKETDPDPYSQVVELASAVRHLHGDWPSEARASEERACELLNLHEDVAWFGRSWREVRECQPPIYQLAGTEHGVLFLRWLLHQVLPYPSFLWDVHRVAIQLRMRVDDLERLIAMDGDLAQDLQQRRYTGILEGFLGEPLVAYCDRGLCVEAWLWGVWGVRNSSETGSARELELTLNSSGSMTRSFA